MLGIDAQAEHVAAARDMCTRHSLSRVAVLQGDPRRTRLRAGSFDAAHARLLLSSTPRPGEVVAEMARPVRPGGVVALNKADLTSVYQRDGANPNMAGQLREMLRRTGLVDVDVDAHAAVYPPGDPLRTTLIDLLASVRDSVLRYRLLSAAETGHADCPAPRRPDRSAHPDRVPAALADRHAKTRTRIRTARVDRTQIAEPQTAPTQ